MAATGVIDGFVLPAQLEASEPPEARGLRRDAVRLLVSRVEDDSLAHSRFNELPRWLAAGDLLVVNTSGTLNAALAATSRDGDQFAVHLSTRLPGDFWVVEVRRPGPVASLPERGARAGIDVRSGRRRPRHAPGAVPLDRRTGSAIAIVDRGAPAAGAGAAVSRTVRPSDSVRLRHAAVARLDVPDRLRDRARQRGDAVGGASVHAGARHAAGVARRGDRTTAPPHRRREPGGSRTALRGILPRAAGNRGSRQCGAAHRPSRRRRRHDGRPRARDRHRPPRHHVSWRRVDQPGDWPRPAAARR